MIPFPIQVPHDNDHTQAVLWGGGGGENWGHLYQPRCPMIPAAHRRCYGGSGEDWGHLSLARRLMIKATHRRCYGKPFSSQVPHVTGHTQAVLCGGGGEDWRHLSQPRCPMIPATHRRCYGGGGEW